MFANLFGGDPVEDFLTYMIVHDEDDEDVDEDFNEDLDEDDF